MIRRQGEVLREECPSPGQQKAAARAEREKQLGHLKLERR
jgi:hypothetical protein